MDMAHTRTTIISALTMLLGEADAMICGTVGASTADDCDKRPR